jgi:hypothetical protein
VRFTGFRHDLPRWLGGLDMLVHPADMEGLGVSLLQAAAAGGAHRHQPGRRPARGGAGRRHRHPVPAGRRGRAGRGHRPPRRRRGLARALRRRRAARILAEFSIDAMVDGNLRVYRQVLGR